jgi:hypothetical protein
MATALAFYDTTSAAMPDFARTSVVIPGREANQDAQFSHLRSGPEPVIGPRCARTRRDHPGMTFAQK